MRKLYGDADDGNPAYSAEIPREWKHSLLSSRGDGNKCLEIPADGKITQDSNGNEKKIAQRDANTARWLY